MRGMRHHHRYLAAPALLTLLALGAAAAATDAALQGERIQPASPKPVKVSSWPSATATHTKGAPPWTHTCSGSANDYNCPHEPQRP